MWEILDCLENAKPKHCGDRDAHIYAKVPLVREWLKYGEYHAELAKQLADQLAYQDLKDTLRKANADGDEPPW
jgi:hypothetical protein